MTQLRHLPLIMLIAALLAACAPASASPMPTPAPAAPPQTATVAAAAAPAEAGALPAPRVQGPLSLEDALAGRRSVRSFSDRRLTPAELGQLLWAAQGITSPAGLRTAPSAGALYPLETYVVTPEGTYRYETQGHRLVPQAAGDVRPALAAAAVGQSSVADAPAVVVIAAVYARTAQKYGTARSPRYVHLEAGHAAQNLLLQAVALDLGAVPIGAFDDAQVQAILRLPSDHAPLYLIPVGHPR